MLGQYVHACLILMLLMFSTNAICFWRRNLIFLDCWYCTIHVKITEHLDWLPDPVLNNSVTEYFIFSEAFSIQQQMTTRQSLKRDEHPMIGTNLVI